VTGTGEAVAGLPQPAFATTFPGPFATGPHADRVERQLLAWLDEHPLVDSDRARGLLANITAQGVSRTFPDAGPEGLVLFADLLLFLTAFDDAHGEEHAAADPSRLVDRTSELTLVLAGHEPAGTSANPFPAALHDLLTRARARTTPTRYLRLTACLRDNLAALVWEAHHLAAPESVPLEVYTAMRPHTVFVTTIIAAAEIVLDYELTDEQRSLAAVRELEAAVADLAGWVNDLASYQREARRAPAAPLSLPTLLRVRHGGDLRDAFARAATLCEAKAETARRHIHDLTAGPPGAMSTHARALESIVHSFAWHTGHARYQG
jgi:hypothetical protein